MFLLENIEQKHWGQKNMALRLRLRICDVPLLESSFPIRGVASGDGSAGAYQPPDALDLDGLIDAIEKVGP